MNRIGTEFLPRSIAQAKGLFESADAPGTAKETSSEIPSFQRILETKKDEELKFSKHANERLESRNIKLSDEQVDRLYEGVSRAREKHVKDSLVMMDDLAFIVSVQNNTVVTALSTNEADSVFTNIDGAVIC